MEDLIYYLGKICKLTVAPLIKQPPFLSEVFVGEPYYKKWQKVLEM